MATTEATGRAGRVRVEQGAKRVRAYLGGELVADTIRPRLVWEVPYYPAYYVPLADVRTDLLVATATVTHSPSRGDAQHFTIKAGGKAAEDAALRYADSRSPNSATSSRAGPTSHPVEPGDLPAGQPNRSRPAVEVSVGFMHHRRSRRFRLLGSNRVSPGRSSVVGGPSTWR